MKLPLGKSLRRSLYTVLAILVLFLGANVLLFEFRGPDHVVPADEIVILGGPAYKSRIEMGRRIADEGTAKLLLLSTPDPSHCPKAHRSRLIVKCFHPDPSTTQGEARYATRTATALKLTSILVVVTADQLLRARLRFSRCWDGPLHVVEAPASASEILSRVLYEDGALVKALVLQRSC